MPTIKKKTDSAGPTVKKRKKRISVAAAKDKGRRLQKRILKLAADLLGVPCGPDEDLASRPMGQSGTDIRISPKLLKKFPYSIECKNQETWSIVQWIKQAKENQKAGTEWLLFVSKNHHDDIVVMTVEHFFELLKRIHNAEKTKNK